MEQKLRSSLILVILAAALIVSTWPQSVIAADGCWRSRAPMLTPRWGAAAVELPGQIWVLGGANEAPALPTVESYDTTRDVWLTGPSLPTSRRGLAAVVLDGKIYAIGGSSATHFLRAVEIYDPATGTWTQGIPLPKGRTEMAAATAAGKIYVFAGVNSCLPDDRAGVCDYTDPATLVYDPATGQWQRKAPSPLRTIPQAVTIDGKIYVFNFWFNTLVYVYDPVRDAFDPAPSLPTAGDGAFATSLGSRLYEGGGQSPTQYLDLLYTLDPLTRIWSPRPSMPTPRRSASAASTGTSFFVVGGVNTTGPLRANEEYREPCAPPPVAIATASPNPAPERTVVTLDGSGSRGDNLRFEWAQIAPTDGTCQASLVDPTAVVTTFTAPEVSTSAGSCTLTFQLTVWSGDQSGTATVNVTDTNVNRAPVAEAVCPAAVNEGSLVTCSGANSYDPDGDPLTYRWVQTDGLAVNLIDADSAHPSFTAPVLPGGIGGPQALSFMLTVSDGMATSSASVQVLVEQVDHAPIANAGTPQTVHPGKLVTLDGSASSDPDNDPLTYQWTQAGGPTVELLNATTATPTFVAPPVSGTVPLTFRLIVSDGVLSSAPAEVVITVKNGPPVCEAARAVPDLLWPPNHGMVPVGIAGVTDPDDTTVALSIVRVTQDEPTNGLGDGDTSPDAIVQGDKVLLRAERSGTGNGRVYQVQFSASDGEGGACSGAVKVVVPHSKKPGVVTIDDGQLCDSTLP